MRIISGLDELESLVGTTLGTSDWVTVTQEMVNVFSEVTTDHQWIHLDVERATRELEVGAPIVQGFLTLSLAVRFRNEIARVEGVSRFINYGLNRVRFPAHRVEWALRSAPSHIRLYDRTGKPSVELGGRISNYGTGSDCPYLLDSLTGERRDFLSGDVEQAVRLACTRPSTVMD